MQNMDMEPLFCTQVAMQKVCPILCLSFSDYLDKVLIKLEESIHQLLQILLFQSTNVHLVIKNYEFFLRGSYH